MPLVEISSELQLFFTSNAPNDDPSKFDHSRPTILLFHPLFMDSTWLRPQFQDIRLASHYNMIAFDGRSSGRTRSKVTPLRDAWVDASDVGVALELLGITRCHIFASQMISNHAAFRFALLFPEKTLSLCLCQLAATTDLEWTKKAYFELVESFCIPPDIEAVERACLELAYLMFGEETVPLELSDEVCAWWQMNFPATATQRTKFLENAVICSGRQLLTDAQLQRLTVPVLVMHGDNYIVSPTDQAEDQAAHIPNSEFVIIKGGPEAFTMVPSCATVVNRVYTTFLSRHPPPPALPPRPPHKVQEILTTALRNLSDAFGDPIIAQREPTSLSFSMSSPELVEANRLWIERYEREIVAVTALRRDGMPIRKVSEKNDSEWSEVALHRVC